MSQLCCTFSTAFMQACYQASMGHAPFGLQSPKSESIRTGTGLPPADRLVSAPMPQAAEGSKVQSSSLELRALSGNKSCTDEVSSLGFLGWENRANRSSMPDSASVPIEDLGLHWVMGAWPHRVRKGNVERSYQSPCSPCAVGGCKIPLSKKA